MTDFTVFTPTYNRAELLPRLYESLTLQSYKNFEWLIVDDGSTDKTENVVCNLTDKTHDFNIRYIKKENGGKHTAINVGVTNALGKYFFIVDSDDWLPTNSLETIRNYFMSLPANEKFCGVGGLKCSSNGKLVGKSFNAKYVDCTSLERRNHQILGDKAEVFYTNILQRYPFPVFQGENFVTETVVWYRIADAGYKIRWFNERIYYCEYLQDGLTQTRGKYLQNYHGFVCRTHDELTYKEIPVLQKIKLIVQCGAYTLIRKERANEISNLLDVPEIVLLTLGALGFIGLKIIKRGNI